jgi:hypothetical protein
VGKVLINRTTIRELYRPEQLPAQLIGPGNENLLRLVDPAAGSRLTRAIRE